MTQDLAAGSPVTCATAVDPSACDSNKIGTRPPRTRAWRDGKVVAEGFPVADVSDHVEAGETVWLDLCAPMKSELHIIADELKLHTLSIEDAVSSHQRAKLDRYADYLFLNAYDVALDVESGQLQTSEMSAFITKFALVTVQDDARFDVDALIDRWDSSPDLAGQGVAFLLHGLLDLLVDNHFAAVQSLDDGIEELEDLLFDDRPRGPEVQRRSFELRKSLVLLRRVVLPMREVVNTLLRRDLHVVDEAMAPYFQDVYDHVLRAAEWTESLRDLVTTILETNLTIQGNRLNLIMKKLTGWAAVIAVPTAITGFYGQNVPYPGFGREWGFVVSVVILLATAGAIWYGFKRRDWL
ncbi:MAG TPA: magnesium transporter CorA family protein [Frankiaceae bacterium]|nr:magnesium transporter CorA family protein [Frankiaceae bacterium]